MLEAALDVLVVGAGPAGLSAGAACAASGRDFAVVELGPSLGVRDHNDQARLTIGVGGCGLFSDGKFSFHPSATKLWPLARQDILRWSYSWLTETIRPFGVKAPAFPTPIAAQSTGGQLASEVRVAKSYPSFYMPFAARKRLTGLLEEAIGNHLIPMTRVTSIRYDDGNRLFDCTGSSDLDQRSLKLRSRAVVFAGGRFSPTTWAQVFPQGRHVFRHVEIGVRLQQAAGDFFLNDDPHLDPKLVFRSADPRYGWRTFCCCREGELISTDSYGIVSVSGRGDGLATGQSNVGFNLRVTDEELGASIWTSLYSSLLKVRYDGVQFLPLSQFMAEVGTEPEPYGPSVIALGITGSRLLAEGINLLADEYGSIRRTPSLIAAPALEGVAYYPDINEGLRANPFPLWVAGDATGLFRGLSAAMISGYYAGIQAADYRDERV